MAQNKLIDISLDFSVIVVNYCKYLQKQHREFILATQLLKSGTSIGANIHEANYAQSRADFISKLQIALKESYETAYWLKVLQRTNYLAEKDKIMIKMNGDLIRMLAASVNTAKGNQ